MCSRRTRGCALVVSGIADGPADGGYDVRAMAELLRVRGLDVEVRTRDRADRAGILTGYDALIAKARPDEPAVVYYTGHGFRGQAGLEGGKYWQAIRPTDAAASTAADFRGITSWELSIKLAALTQRTSNATVILDCCYAGQMSRDPAIGGVVAKSLPYPSLLGFDAHLRALRETYGPGFDAVDAVGNPNAVRLVACAQDEYAGRYQAQGEYRSVFTDALVEVVREVGDAQVSWAAILPAIRARVRRRSLTQCPQAEGPARRRLFSEIEDVGGEAAVVTRTADGYRIAAGKLLGVSVGDVFAVMASATQRDRAAALAEVTVREVSAMSAVAELRGSWSGEPALPDGAIAIPLERAAVRRAVRIDVPDPVRAPVEQAIFAAATLRVAGLDEAAVATLQLCDGGLAIEDPRGRVHRAAQFPDGLADALHHLANLSAAEALRDLEGEHGVLASELEIEWGIVDRGQLRPMPAHGGALSVGDRAYVKVRTRASRELCVHVLNIGVRGTIALITADDPAGIALNEQRSEVVLGEREDGMLLGYELTWPGEPPRDDSPTIDELVVIATSCRTSLLALETVERVEDRAGTARGAQLAELLGGLDDGLSRRAGDLPTIDGFFLKRLSCMLHPGAVAVADIALAADVEPPAFEGLASGAVR